MKHRVASSRELSGVGESVAIEGEEHHHLTRVVRARQGELIEIFAPSGKTFVARVLTATKEQSNVEIVEEIESREPRSGVVIAAALIQFEKFEFILQKCTELGAVGFVPVVSERTEIAAERAAGKLERWTKIIAEAVKQSGRSVVPRIEGPVPFEKLLQLQGVVIFDADNEGPPGTLRSDAILAIGPEGGWSEKELADARAAGARFRSLGKRRLRAETAAITALALVQSELGELR